MTNLELDEPSDNQDEPSPLKKDIATSSTVPATAPPPYTSIPTTSPNPIPSSQAIPQTDPQPHHVILPRRGSPIRRFLAAFAVAWLVLLLWSILVDSFHKARHLPPLGRRPSYEYEIDSSRRWQLQKGIDDTGRVLPIQYPPIQLPKLTE